MKKLRYKCKMFQQLEAGKISQGRYRCAARVCRKVKKKAYACYQKKLKTKLDSMSNSDKNFWSLAKDISGLSQERLASCPDVDSLADHFAEKMSNGKDVEADCGSVSTHPPVALKSWGVRFKQVLKTLRALDPSKSANGVGPRFLKECCTVIAPATTKLFRFIVA